MTATLPGFPQISCRCSISPTHWNCEKRGSNCALLGTIERLNRPPRTLLGVELLRHGGPDYTATQMGGLYALPLGGRSAALIKGGLRHDEGSGTGGYAGVELSLPY